MRAGTARKLLIVLGTVVLVPMLLLALTGDDTARRELPAQIATWALIGGLFVAGWWFKVRPRRELHRGEARNLGLTSAQGDPLGFLDRGFHFLRVPASMREVENTSWGTWRGMEVAVFDYWLSRSSRPERDDIEYYTCAVATVPPGWPGLAVFPQRFEGRLADVVGRGDQDLELEAFNRAFEVRTDDRRFASALLDPRMMEWLLGLPDGSGFEIAGDRLLFHTPRRVDRDLEHVLETLATFRDRIPPVVRSLFPNG